MEDCPWIPDPAQRLLDVLPGTWEEERARPAYICVTSGIGYAGGRRLGSSDAVTVLCNERVVFRVHRLVVSAGVLFPFSFDYLPIYRMIPVKSYAPFFSSSFLNDGEGETPERQDRCWCPCGSGKHTGGRVAVM